MSYVEVPSDALLGFLVERGFTERKSAWGGATEVVYERAHSRDPRFKVLVYTSIRRGKAKARAYGKDAIRVCAIFETPTGSRGVAKLPRVHRSGSVEAVLDRMLERMRDAYARCNREIARGESQSALAPGGRHA